MSNRKVKWEADFSYLLKVLEGKPTDRPVLFEFFMNDTVYHMLTEGMQIPDGTYDFQRRYKMIHAFHNAGYDYATWQPPSDFVFASHQHKDASTYSLNEGTEISDRESFEKHSWPSVGSINWAFLENLIPHVPDGMKLVACGPGGVEENVISLVGFENLSYMMIDDPDLVSDLFEAVGSRLVEYYSRICQYDIVGACISNDDWGFNTQTFLSPEQMEKWLFPWHRKITDVIRQSGRPVILHSCGNIYPVMDTVVDELHYSGKHSYEDNIKPVEEAWEEYHDRIAILGGIDVDFMIRSSEEEVYERSRRMLERTSAVGAYALGTGNSVPEYLPIDKYLAMLEALYDWN